MIARDASMAPRPLYAADAAVLRARARVGRGVYRLGTGDIDSMGDDPRDCFGFAVCECFGLRRHRPGFNRGWTDAAGGATVVDDLNSNSAREDALHAQELFAIAVVPEPGLLIVYPTIYPTNGSGHAPQIGHAKIIVGVSRCLEWDAGKPDWALLDTVECMGPPGRRPGIVTGTGAAMVDHDRKWPHNPEHRTAMLRVRP